MNAARADLICIVGMQFNNIPDWIKELGLQETWER